MPDRYLKPDWFTAHIFNPFVGLLTRLGISVYGSAVLAVRGRKSGEWRTTPVNPLEYRGERYLVAPRGVTEWVRNIRVSGGGELRVGPRHQAIRVVELTDDEKPEVLRYYLRRWSWETGAFFEGLTADASDAEIRAAAPRHPVFRILK
jgi:deazaflavin-dependent oxidoreductase (nitroreductase family)